MTTSTSTTIDTSTTSINAPVIVGLCAGRHVMPVTDFIYSETVYPTDFSGMEKVAEEFIVRHVGLCHVERRALDQAYNDDVVCWTGKRSLIVYVTGLTACTAAVIKVCALNGISLTLMHYDRESGEYLPQQIF